MKMALNASSETCGMDASPLKGLGLNSAIPGDQWLWV